MLKYIGILELVYLFSLYSVGTVDIPKDTVVDDTTRVNIERMAVVVVVAEVRRAKLVIFLGKISRRNLIHSRLHNSPLLLQYT